MLDPHVIEETVEVMNVGSPRASVVRGRSKDRRHVRVRSGRQRRRCPSVDVLSPQAQEPSGVVKAVLERVDGVHRGADRRRTWFSG